MGSTLAVSAGVHGGKATTPAAGSALGSALFSLLEGGNVSVSFGAVFACSGTNVSRKTPDSVKATTAMTIARRADDTAGKSGGIAVSSG